MKFKKVVSAVLVSALAVSMMAGCGSKSGSSDSKSDVFKIGGIGPMTGDAAAYGEAVDNGAKLAVEEINKNGGINGKQVEFKTEDDQADAEKAVNAYNTLKDWGMQILMGTVTSGSCTAVASETDSDHMFQITPSGTAVESVQDHDNVFRLCFSDPEQGTKSAEYIAKNKLATKIAVIYNSSDVYSNGIYTNFAAEAKKEGLDVVAAEAFTADNKTDFSVQLKKAQSSGADLVFLPIYYQEASAILQQAAKLDYHPTFFGCDGLDGILGVEGFDTYVTTDTFYMNGDIMKLLDAEDVDIFAAYKEMGVELKEEDIQTSITVQFPNAIVSTNGAKDASNPNAAIFSVPLTGKINMFATTKAGVTEASVKATIKKLNTVKATKIKSLKANKVKKNAKKATVTLKFKKVKGIKKYEVEYSLKKNFKKSKVKTAKKTTYTIKNLKKGKKYYVRVRATKTNYAGNAIYSKWVKKSVKTKK